MPTHTIDESQRKASKLAGSLYLLTIASANLTEFYVRGRLMVHNNPAQTASNIVASGQLFRAGIAGDLITLAGEVALAAVLYTILKPVNRSLAVVAVFWRLVDCSIAAATTATDFGALLLLGGTVRVTGFTADQWQAMARLFISLDTGGNRIAAVFFGLGSLLFSYLWFKSRYVPRVVAAWGILASLVPITVPLAAIVLPSLADAPLRRARTGIPIVVFEIVLGLWLVVKGIRMPGDNAV